MTVSNAVRMIFSAYRRDDYADAESFVMQLGLVLERYSDEVIVRVSHPASGVQRRCKFPPSIAEVVEACDDAAESAATAERYRKMGKFQPVTLLPLPSLANVLVYALAPQYAAMTERAHNEPENTRMWRYDPDGRGIWVNLSWLEEQRGRTKMRRFTAADLRNLPEAPAA